MMNRYLKYAFILVLIYSSFKMNALLSVHGNSKTLELKQTLPEVALRGYGKVSGKYWNGKNGSVLEVDCESDEKAKLTQAKYLSDLKVLPGVSQGLMLAGGLGIGSFKVKQTKVEIHQIKGQGEVTALRDGAKILILAAPSRRQLELLIDEGITGRLVCFSSSADTDVPMWLDRWDKYGFRFYYEPFALPEPQAKEMQLPDGVTNATYDFTKDFDFAEKNNAGLVLWSTLSEVGMADGLTNECVWRWVEDWAGDKKLPVGINLSAANFTVPNWIANRYRDQTMLPMPGYLGDSMSIANGRGVHGKNGELAWGSSEARDAMLGALQQTVKNHTEDYNVVSWLEPHNEFYQGGDAFMGYGPAADRTFRTYLESKYQTVGALSKAWGRPIASWDAVKALELAEFAGWGPDAVDLGGMWKVAYPENNKPAPEFWTAEKFDDSAWQSVKAPGDDRNFYLPKKPAVYRRTVQLSGEWLQKHPRTWIYLWDLNKAFGNKVQPVSISLNGKKLGEEFCQDPKPHWMAVEATSAIRGGANQLSLCLPSGYLGYRVYLSSVEPKQYPNLGKELNARWVDFVDWRESVRMDSARRGIEMIREVDPNRQIDLMAPHGSADGLKGLAEQFGANFKDTGGMSGVWMDLLPSLMRGSGLPFSLEPGGPAKDLPEFKKILGLWHTEGLQAVDYFIHLHCVMLNPAIKKYYEETLPLWQLFGKYHQPKADLAFLWDMRIGALTGFPWGSDLNTNSGSGWDCRGVPESLMKYCLRDGLTESDFSRGNAARYKVVIDTNTSILDKKTLNNIKKYVEGGGVFITLGQTGRHTPEVPNSWPISKLTGYDVLTYEKFGPDGHGIARFAADDPNPGSPWQQVKAAAGQTIYPDAQAWMKSPYGTGLRMKKAANDVQDLLLWQDGTVAVGLRKLGKGSIISFGYKANGRGVGMAPEALLPLLKWAGVKMTAAEVEVANKPNASLYYDYIFRHYMSNNGLYDVWVLMNPNAKEARNVSLVFKETNPSVALDVKAGKEISVSNQCLGNIAMEPLETRIFLTARNELSQAPLEWFELQRSWWKGTTPVSKGFPKPSDNFVHVLGGDWAWRSVEKSDNPEEWAKPDYDDSKWERLSLGVWTTPEGKHDTKDAVFRKTFTVPASWDKGRVGLWLGSGRAWAFSGKGRMWLDGRVISTWAPDSYLNADEFEGTFKPGTTHTLVIETRGEGRINGVPSDAWLAFIPDPDKSIDLAGQWTFGKEIFKEAGSIQIPGRYEAKALRRSIWVPKDYGQGNVVLTIRAERVFSVLINGSLVTFAGRPSRGGNQLNLTPWIKFGEENEIELFSVYDKGEIKRISLDLYKARRDQGK